MGSVIDAKLAQAKAPVLISAETARSSMPPKRYDEMNQILDNFKSGILAAAREGKDYYIVQHHFTRQLESWEFKYLERCIDEAGYSTMDMTSPALGRIIYMIKW